jgi:UDP-N-acetylmuramate--alanine ligase
MSTKQHIHFIGIGGIGMSALARFWHHEGAVVTGSDRAPSIVTAGLEALGIEIAFEQKAENIRTKKDLGLVVYTEAMTQDHPEMMAAREQNIPMVNYFEALGQVANEYYLIAVAGTHGKTTTTAMLIDVLEEAGLDPTGIVGSLRSKTQSNFRPGKSKYAVVEACEYKRDFLYLRPDVLVITNIEYEHVDYYKSLADVQQAFREFIALIPEDGLIVANVADPNVAPVLRGVQSTVVDYRPYIDLSLKLRQPGLHNRMNAACARAVGSWLQIEQSVVTTALENFAGTWRRFEYKGDVIPVTGGRVPVYDDYGHHPTELAATFKGARELYPDKRLLVVFQSHTYSRTHELLKDFVDALTLADQVFLLPIYAAREVNTWGVSSEQIKAQLEAQDTSVMLYETPAAIAEALKQSVVAGDVIVVIGAGQVTEVAKLLTT